MLLACLAHAGTFLYVIRSPQQCLTCHFLLPAGGAMTVTEYEHGHVFRTERLSKV